MNYQRIYDEFIADRRSKPVPMGYTERHHILPRSLGGSDDPENLIDLTAEDHLFAHMLLAKIYGGGMWHAVCIMMGKGSQKRRISNRKLRTAYQISRVEVGRVQSERVRGENHPLFGKVFTPEQSEAMRVSVLKSYVGRDVHNKDNSDRVFKHVATGEIFTGSRHEFAEHIGTDIGVRHMILGHHKSCRGWIIDGRDEDIGKAHGRGNKDNTIYEFEHWYGATEKCEPSALMHKYEISPAGMTNIKQGGHAKGWYLKGNRPDTKPRRLIQ